MNKGKCLEVVFGGLVPALALCLMGFSFHRHHERYQRREFHMPMKTYAAGRFQIDIPEPSTLAGWGRQDIREGSIDVFPRVTRQAFRKTIRERAAELKSVEMDFTRFINDTSLDAVDAGHGTLLEGFIEGPPENATHVLFWDKDGIKSAASRRETYLWLEDPDDGPGTGYQFQGGMWMDPDKQQASLRILSTELAAIRRRRDDEVPEGPGFCFQGAFLPAEVSDWDFGTEAIGAEWRLGDHPDVVISLYTQEAPDEKPDGLIARSEKSKEFLTVSEVRKQKRTIDGYPGEEVINRIREDHGVTCLNAMWEFEGGGLNDLTRPYIMVQMFTGEGGKNPVKSRLSEGDFLAMWDAVLGSFRWRGIRPDKPVKPGTVPQPPVSRTPLGTTLSSTGYCPESGIWECGNPNDRYGRRQYYQKGRPFHGAALPARRGLIGWLRRDPDELWVPTTWTLVDYKDEP